jgi:formylglycine-generating enzyme required for sulfatase activity
VRRADFYNGKYGDFVTDFTEIGKMIGSDDFTTSLDDVFIWTGVTNNPAYKTTKLVLRKIKAKDRHFYMGAAGITNEEVSIAQQYSCLASDIFRVKVSFTNDYWIGVFEVTEKQYALLTGADASSISADASVKPCKGIKYSAMRGSPSSWGKWPADVYEVTAGSVLSTIRDRISGMVIDLPTEAQWEYASRAGTDTQLYCGRRLSGSANHENASADVAWNHGSTPQDENGNKSVMTVGLLLPNAYGLYDTLGNASELVRDIFDPEKPALTGNPSGPEPLTADIEEPMGWTDSTAAALKGDDCKGMYRGGNYNRNYTFSHSACRREWANLNKNAGAGSTVSGFRLWIKGE